MTLNKLKNFTLQRRLTFTVSLIFIVSYLAALSLTQWIYLYYLDQQTNQRLLNLAGDLVTLVYEIDLENDTRDFNILGRLLLQEKELQYVFIHDPQKNNLTLSPN